MNLAEQLKDAEARVAALECNVKGLTAELDQATNRVHLISAERDEATKQVKTISAERDQAVEQVKTVSAERDQAVGQAQAAVKERDAVKAQLALSPGHRDLSAGTEAGQSGTQAGEGQGDEAFLKAYRAAKPAERRKMWQARGKAGYTFGGLMLTIAAVGAALLFGGVMLADAADKAYDQVILETTNAPTGTVATTVSDTLVGVVESITVIVPTGSTCDVAVATSTLTLLTKTGSTGTATYLPRYSIHDSVGAVNTNTTDAVDKVVVVDTVTASFDECSSTGKTVKVLINYGK